MPPRKQPKREAQKHEMEAFAEKYDTLAMIYSDPVEVVFAIMDKNFRESGGDQEVALRAAEILASYRYPRVKAIEGAQPSGPVLQFSINVGGEKSPIDVTPRPPELTIG